MTERSREGRASRLYLLDAAVGIAITAAYISLAAVDVGPPLFSGPAWLGWLIAAGVGLPVAARRRWPRAMLAIVMASLTAATLLDITREPYLAAAFALYAVGLLCPLRRSAPVLAAALSVAVAGLYVGQVLVTPNGSATDAAGLAAAVCLLMSGAWTGGALNRRWRAEATRAAERTREQTVVAERLRIARELHDLVSHNLSLIAVQAGVANHVAASHPDRALEALRGIEVSSRRALVEMRSMLGVLRTPDMARDEPAPGLADLPDLAERTRAAGIRVELVVPSETEAPAEIQLAAYRIVQEALTNVAQHAGPAHCSITIFSNDHRLTVEVLDDGRGSPGRSANGHGLVGMKERVALYGGDLRAAPRVNGGFAVEATLPFGDHGK